MTLQFQHRTACFDMKAAWHECLPAGARELSGRACRLLEEARDLGLERVPENSVVSAVMSHEPPRLKFLNL